MFQRNYIITKTFQYGNSSAVLFWCVALLSVCAHLCWELDIEVLYKRDSKPQQQFRPTLWFEPNTHKSKNQTAKHSTITGYISWKKCLG